MTFSVEFVATACGKSLWEPCLWLGIEMKNWQALWIFLTTITLSSVCIMHSHRDTAISPSNIIAHVFSRSNPCPFYNLVSQLSGHWVTECTVIRKTTSAVFLLVFCFQNQPKKTKRERDPAPVTCFLWNVELCEFQWYRSLYWMVERLPCHSIFLNKYLSSQGEASIVRSAVTSQPEQIRNSQFRFELDVSSQSQRFLLAHHRRCHPNAPRRCAFAKISPLDRNSCFQHFLELGLACNIPNWSSLLIRDLPTADQCQPQGASRI